MTTTPNDAAVNAESALGTWFVVVQFNTRDDADEFIEDHLQDEPFTVEYEPSNIERHAAKPVNTESAAKLVSDGADLLRQIAALTTGGEYRALKRYVTRVNDLIERHATPQTQATHGVEPFDKRCADALADEVAVLVRRRVIDMRSPAADALLDYRSPPSTPRADRLAELEAAALSSQATHGEGEAVGYVDRSGLEMFRAGTLETLLMHRQKQRLDYAHLYTQPAPSPTAAGELGKALHKAFSFGEKHWADADSESYSRNKRAAVTYEKFCQFVTETCAALSGVAAQGDKPRFDEAQFAEMTRKGAEAWKDVPDVAVWINEQRGAQEGGVPKGWTIAPQGDAILVRGPGGDAYLSDEKHNSPVSVIVLFRLAKALLAAQRDGEARVSEDAEFQLYCDDEPVAVASGPRKDALREIHHYALQYNQDGAVRIEEVIRKPLSAIENVMSLGVADQRPNIDLAGQG